MIQQHTELYKRLTPVQTLALWNHLYNQRLVPEPPDPRIATGEVLAEKCQHLSHAEVVLTMSTRTETFWCDILCCLLEKPIYLCARGETGVPLTDIEGRPLPLPIGHRRGQPAGTGGLPKRIAARVQYQRKHDPRVIVQLVERNPKIPNTKAYDRYKLYKLGMSVSEYLALGGLPGDIVHDVKKGFIVVDVP